MRNVWGIIAIFMAFWSAFSHKKEWGHLLERILYTFRYSITLELLQLLVESKKISNDQELIQSDPIQFQLPISVVFFDRHPQLVCERVKELNYMCHTHKEHVLPGL